MSTTPVTFCHQIANSTCYLQEPGSTKEAPTPIKTITFHGKPGGIGYYETATDWEIHELSKLADNPQVQISRIDKPLKEADVAPDRKAEDPAIKQAVTEVQMQAANAADPKLIAAQQNLGKLLATQAGTAAA